MPLCRRPTSTKHPVQIVAFCFEFLTRERLAGKDDVLLVPGSISYLLANSGALPSCVVV